MGLELILWKMLFACVGITFLGYFIQHYMTMPGGKAATIGVYLFLWGWVFLNFFRRSGESVQIIFYASDFLVIFLLFMLCKERFLEKLNAYLFCMTSMFSMHILIVTIFYALPHMLWDYRFPLFDFVASELTWVFYLLYVLVILFVVQHYWTSIELWKRRSHYVSKRDLFGFYSYPMLIVIMFSSILYNRIDQLKHVTLLCTIFIAIEWSYLLIARVQKSIIYRKEKQDILLMKVMAGHLKKYESYNNEITELKEWNHDISNHLQTLNYLVKDGAREEALRYIHQIEKEIQKDET